MTKILNTKKLSWKITIILSVVVVVVATSLSIYMETRILSEISLKSETQIQVLAYKTAGNFNSEISVTGHDMSLDQIKDFLSSVKVYNTGIAFVIGKAGEFIESSSFINSLNAEEKEILKSSALSDRGEAFSLVLGGVEYIAASGQLVNGSLIGVLAPESEVNAEVSSSISRFVIIFIIVLTLVLIISVVVGYFSTSSIVKPLVALTGFMERAAVSGDLALAQDDVRIIDEAAHLKDEIGRITKSSLAFIDRVVTVSNMLESISLGDLSGKIHVLSSVDVMGNSISTMIDSLNKMFEEISIATAKVSSRSTQISDGAQALASGSTEQAANIQELSATAGEIAEATKTSAEMAAKAAALASTIKGNAEKGSLQMEEMMSAVNDIRTASQNIGKVIKVIDDIAFQTNILALNAAVEAARAGQHGKGFAVVADEVRNLATKSAEAAKDTGDLITNSMKKAEHGVHMARDTAESLSEIVSGINVSNEIIDEIAESSKHQSTSLDHITDNIDHVVNVIQQNTATSEESAASALELSGQATTLKHLVSRFKLKEDEPHLLYIPGSGDTSTL